MNDYDTLKESDFAVLEALYVDGWKPLSYIGPERTNFYFGGRPQDRTDYEKVRIRYLDGKIHRVSEWDGSVSMAVKPVLGGSFRMSIDKFVETIGYQPMAGTTIRVRYTNKSGEFLGRGTVMQVTEHDVLIECPELTRTS